MGVEVFIRPLCCKMEVTENEQIGFFFGFF